MLYCYVKDKRNHKSDQNDCYKFKDKKKETKTHKN